MTATYPAFCAFDTIKINVSHKLSLYCTSYQKLACFVLYRKIINTLKNNYASYSKLSKELKNGIGILVGQVVFKLWIKTFKMLFGSLTQEPLGLLKFWCYFEFFGQFTIRCIHYFFKKVLIILRVQSMLILV